MLRTGACENASESIQEASKSLRTPPRGLQERPRAPERPPRASKTPPRASTRHPRASKRASKRSKRPPGGLQDTPQRLQERSRSPPKRLPRAPQKGYPFWETLFSRIHALARLPALFFKPVLAREREARYGETASCMRSVTRRGEEENTGRKQNREEEKG